MAVVKGCEGGFEENRKSIQIPGNGITWRGGGGVGGQDWMGSEWSVVEYRPNTRRAICLIGVLFRQIIIFIQIFRLISDAAPFPL